MEELESTKYKDVNGRIFNTFNLENIMDILVSFGVFVYWYGYFSSDIF